MVSVVVVAPDIARYEPVSNTPTPSPERSKALIRDESYVVAPSVDATPVAHPKDRSVVAMLAPYIPMYRVLYVMATAAGDDDAEAAMLMELTPTTIAQVAKFDDAATVAIWLLPKSS